MNPELHQRASDLLVQAFDYPPEARLEFLRTQCGSDPDLYREACSLLEHAASSGVVSQDAIAKALAGRAVSACEESLVGRTIGRFQIIDELGRGGMGVVWRADDPLLNRRVAIKFLPAKLADSPIAREQFLREARSASTLDHSAIATIYDFGESEGKFFIALRLVEGETVAQRLRSGPLPVATAISVAIDVAHALVHAHKRGVLHRDVSTNNIMITPDGRGVLVDFGLAASSGAARSSIGKRGTPNYIAPEIMAGTAADERTDVFALGVVLYEMLTGRDPFPKDARSRWMHGEAVAPPTPPARSARNAPAGMDTLVLRAIETDRQRRTPNAAALVAQLEGLLAESRNATRRRNLTAAILLFVVGIVATFALQLSRRGGAASPVDPALAVWTVGGTGTLEAVALESLLQTGLSECSPARVVSSELVHAIRAHEARLKRPDGAIEIARQAGATVVLVAGVGQSSSHGPVIEWKLLETRRGRTLGNGSTDSRDLMSATDSIIRAAVPGIAVHAGRSVEPERARSVSVMTTSSPEAYRLYVQSINTRDVSDHKARIADLEAALELDSTFAVAVYALSREVFEEGVDVAAATTLANLAWRHRSRLSLRDRLRLEAWRERLAWNGTSALETYQEMLTRWPDDRDVLVEITLANWWYWRWSESLRYAQMGRALYPDDPDLTMSCVMGLTRANRTAEAIPLARKWIALHNSFDAWDELANAYIAASMPDSAAAALEEGMRADPNPTRLMQGEVKVAYYRGDLDGAAALAETLAVRGDLSPYDRYYARVDAYLGVAGFYMEAGRFQDALDLVRDECRRNAGQLRFALLSSDLCLFLSRAGRHEEALNFMAARRRSSKWPKNQPANVVTGEINSLIALGRFDEARRALEANAEQSKTTAVGVSAYHHFALARIDLAQGNPDLALKTLEHVVVYGPPQEGPIDIQYHELLARAYRALGRLSEAEKMLRYMVHRYPSHMVGHYLQGQVMEETGALNEAKDEYRRFLAGWSRADPARPELADARQRLALLER